MKRYSLFFCAIAVCLLNHKAVGQTYITADTTINTAIPGVAYIGRDSSANNFNPTVNLVSGGSISGDGTVSVYTYNQSVFNITGGTIANFLIAQDHSIVNLSSDALSTGFTGISAQDSATVFVTGGHLTTLGLQGNSMGYVSGSSTISNILTSDNAHLVVSGSPSILGSVQITGMSTVDITGGTFTGEPAAFQGDAGSTLHISGGTIGSIASAGMTDISGGSISQLGGNLFNLYGGFIDQGGQVDTLNVYGGTFNAFATFRVQTLNEFGDGVNISHVGKADGPGYIVGSVNVYGTNLQSVFDSVFTPGPNSPGYVRITGLLADGSPLNQFLQVSNDHSVFLNDVTPEPGSLGLAVSCGLVGTGLLRRRRRQLCAD